MNGSPFVWQQGKMTMEQCRHRTRIFPMAAPDQPTPSNRLPILNNSRGSGPKMLGNFFCNQYKEGMPTKGSKKRSNTVVASDSAEQEKSVMSNKRLRKSIIPSNFTKTPFHLRHPVRGTSVIREALTNPASLVALPPSKWRNSHLGELMSILTSTHSLEADDAEMESAVKKFGLWAMGKKEVYDAMDPCYVFLNWGELAPQPLKAFQLNQTLQGASAPVQVPHFPQCYSVTNEHLGAMLVGSVTTQFAGVRAFIWSVSTPIVSNIR
eukprot:gene34516-41791_t